MPACPICENSSYRKFYDYGSHSLVECERCHHIYQPIFGDVDSYNSLLVDEVYNDRWVKMREQFETDTFRQHTVFAVNLLRGFVKSGANILEFGSGTGEFLSLSCKYLYHTLGVEPSLPARQYIAEKYKIRVYATLKELEVENTNLKFDAICFWHVFEHIPNPKTFLDIVKELLVPGGLVFLSVPNQTSFTNQICGPLSVLFYEKDHLQHFNKTGLESVLKRNFDIISLFSREEHDRLKMDMNLLPGLDKNATNMDFKQLMDLTAQLEREYRGHELFCVARAKAI